MFVLCSAINQTVEVLIHFPHTFIRGHCAPIEVYNHLSLRKREQKNVMEKLFFTKLQKFGTKE